MPAPVTPDELHVRLVTRIREVAKVRGLSIEALARAAGVSESYLWKVLAGRYSPSVRYVARLAAGLEVDPVELFRPPSRSRAG